MSEEAKYQEAVQRSIELFGEALLHQDFFACVKQIGVLEYLQVPDIEAYSGLAYHMAGEYKKAVELFEKVDPKSPIYGQIIHSLAIDYMFLGDYLALDELLCKEEYKCSALEELDIRIKCLEHSSAEYIRDNLEKLKAITSREVPPSNYQDNDAEIFFGICRMMADALVITGECMNQCGNYQRRLGEPLEKFSENDDMTPFIIQYQKWCHILSYSKYLQKIKIAGDIESLATCALYDK